MTFETCVKTIKDNVDQFLADGDVSHLTANASVWARLKDMGRLDEADEIFQREALAEFLEPTKSEEP